MTGKEYGTIFLLNLASLLEFVTAFSVGLISNSSKATAQSANDSPFFGQHSFN